MDATPKVSALPSLESLRAQTTSVEDAAIEVSHDHSGAGFTVREVARRYRVGADKVRAWIKAGELAAINTSAILCGRPRFVITRDALFAFEQRRTVSPPKKQPRRKRRAELVDFYPD